MAKCQAKDFHCRIFTYVYLHFSLFYLYSFLLFFALLIAIVIIRFDNFWREKNGEMQESKDFHLRSSPFLPLLSLFLVTFFCIVNCNYSIR